MIPPRPRDRVRDSVPIWGERPVRLALEIHLHPQRDPRPSSRIRNHRWRAPPTHDMIRRNSIQDGDCPADRLPKQDRYLRRWWGRWEGGVGIFMVDASGESLSERARRDLEDWTRWDVRTRYKCTMRQEAGRERVEEEGGRGRERAGQGDGDKMIAGDARLEGGRETCV